MLISLQKEDSLFKYKFIKNVKNSDNLLEKIFFETNLNIIFFDKNYNEIKNLSINNLEEYKKIYNTLNFKKMLIFTYNYQGNKDLINFLNNEYKLQLINFCNLNLIYYTLIDNTININDENLTGNLLKHIEINMLKKSEINLGNYQKKLLNLDLDITNFIKKIKLFTLKDLDYYKNKIKKDYNKLNIYIKDVNKSYDLVNRLINENNDFLKIEKKKEINYNKIEMDKNDDEIKVKQFYFNNLIKKIEFNELIKKKNTRIK